MMNRLLLITILFTCCLTNQCRQPNKESFEGIVTFQLQYTPKNPVISLKALKGVFGDSAIAYIKDGYYRQQYFTSNGFKDVYYNPVTNLYYFKLNGIDTLYYVDCSVELKKLDSISTINPGPKILGYECKILKMNFDKTTVSYYYAPKLFINPKFYEKHKLGGYDVFLNEAKSVYLKLKHEDDKFGYELTASSIQFKKLNADIFKLPDLPLKKK